MPTPAGETSGLVIGPDGTIYGAVGRELWARHPDGSEAWTHTFSDPNFSAPAPPFAGPPAVGSDGTVYVPSRHGYPAQPALVAVSSNGVERWAYVFDAEYGRAPSPVIDGEGKVLFCAAAHLVALSPTDGTVLWDTEAGPTKAAPAVADDGTVLIVTNDGVLIALGVGCPEEAVTNPPFTFRRVAGVADVIAGHTIEQILDFEIGADGTVAFKAQVGGGAGDAVFVEQGGGAFAVLAPGMTLDGHTLASVEVPRRDDNGNTYLAAGISGAGAGVFVNGGWFLAESPMAAPVVLATLDADTYVDHDESGHMLVYGKRIGDSRPSLLSVNTSTLGITPLLTEQSAIDGFGLDSIWPAWVDGYGNDGAVVARAEDLGQFAIVTQAQVIVRTGDRVSGQVVSYVADPRRNASGTVYYRGQFDAGAGVFRRSPAGADAVLVAAGDTVVRQPIVNVGSFAVNNGGRVRLSRRDLGRAQRLLYMDQDAIAIENVTSIAGLMVLRVGHEYSTTVSMNDARRVAFVAQLAGGSNRVIRGRATPAVRLR